jgi:hypothetical protein
MIRSMRSRLVASRIGLAAAAIERASDRTRASLQSQWGRGGPRAGHWRQLAWYARWIALTLIVLWCAWLVPFMLQNRPGFTDAWAYWHVRLDPSLYSHVPGQVAFLYSPLAAQLFAPLTLLPYWTFYTLILAISVLCLVWLVGPIWGLLAIALPPVAQELAQGNIHFLLAVLLVFGLRRRGWWAAFPLTKVSPGVLLVYDAFRGDWRSLARSLGMTAAPALASFAIAPDLWFAWIRLLVSADTSHVVQSYIWLPLPLGLRLAGALILIWWAARSGRIWLLAVALTIAMPIVWMNSLVILLAIPRLSRFVMPKRRPLRAAEGPVAVGAGERETGQNNSQQNEVHGEEPDSRHAMPRSTMSAAT